MNTELSAETLPVTAWAFAVIPSTRSSCVFTCVSEVFAPLEQRLAVLVRLADRDGCLVEGPAEFDHRDREEHHGDHERGRGDQGNDLPC